MTLVSRFDRQERIEGWNQQALADASVLLVGAGTTGGEVAKNLALIGIGRCDIVDNDLVEEVNLSRCAMFRREDIARPKSEALAERVRPLCADGALFSSLNFDVIEGFGSAEYRRYKAIISAVDNLAARAWLNRYCRLSSVTFIDTGIGGLNWQVTLVPGGAEACLECAWGSSEYDRLADRHSCSQLGIAQHNRVIPMVITTAAQVAGLAVEILAARLHGIDADQRVRTWSRQGRYDSWLAWTTVARADCVAHRWDTGETVFEGSIDQSVSEIASQAALALGSDLVELEADRPIVLTALCRHCGNAAEIKPTPLSQFVRSLCTSCNWLDVVPSNLSLTLPSDLTPRQLGIPPNHLLRLNWLRGETVCHGWMLAR